MPSIKGEAFGELVVKERSPLSRFHAEQTASEWFLWSLIFHILGVFALYRKYAGKPGQVQATTMVESQLNGSFENIEL